MGKMITSITDLILSFVAIGFGVILYKHWRNTKSVDYKCWTSFMIMLGTAAFIGTIYHGINFFHGPEIRFLIRCFLGLALVSWFVGSSVEIFGMKKLNAILWIAAFYSFFFYFIQIQPWARNYLFVDIFVLLTFSFSLCLYIWLLVKKPSKKAKLMIIGIIGLIFSSLIRASKTTLLYPLTSNDIYHIVGIVALYILYRAMKVSNTTHVV